jgi:hypothetical protein
MGPATLTTMLSRISSGRGSQRDLRDIGGQQTGGRLNMQPSGLMNIYASPSCVNVGRILTPWRRTNVDPLAFGFVL